MSRARTRRDKRAPSLTLMTPQTQRQKMSTELIDTAEIARILGVSRAHCVGRLIKRPDFPRPAVNISQRSTRQGHQSAYLDRLARGTAAASDPISVSCPADTERRRCGVVGVAHVGLPGPEIGGCHAGFLALHSPASRARRIRRCARSCSGTPRASSNDWYSASVSGPRARP